MIDEGLARWQGRTALVTGASSGIGRACALALARAGLRVIVSARRTHRLESLAAEIRADGGEVTPIAADLTDPVACVQLVKSAAEVWGELNVLIHCAGTSCGPVVLGADPFKLSECIDLNLRAGVLCLHTGAEIMQSQDEAALVVISSMTAHRVIVGRTPALYAATKSALSMVVDGLRAEVASAGLPFKVGMVSPGMVETEFHAGRSNLPAYRALQADDVASAVLYILSTPPGVQINDILLRSSEQVE
jgi:NADP-dependent 3-hydroxy acid dehydrogenase YdfG